MSKQTVLVTGGGSGIGRQLVRLFARDGYRIIVFSLDQAELDSLAAELEDMPDAPEFQLVQSDISHPETAHKIYNFCIEHRLQIDVLVNNAGFGMFGEHSELDIERLEKMITLNTLALANLCHLFGRDMKERGSGRILNIGSMAGMVPSPLLAAYSATKAFVNHFSVSLAEEMRPYGVSVSCLCPGTTDTKFVKAAEGLHATSDKMAKLALSSVESVELVAAAGYHGLQTGRVIILPSMKRRLQVLITGLIPRTTLARALYRQAMSN